MHPTHPAQHARTLQQQYSAAASNAAYTEGVLSAAALEAAPPPADAAAAVAAALGLPMAPAGSTDSYPSTASIPAGQLSTDFPAISAGQDVMSAQAGSSAAAGPAGSTISGTAPALQQQQQQPDQQRVHMRQHRRPKEGEMTEADISQPSDFGYDVFELPSTASTEEQQQPQPQQTQQPQSQPQQLQPPQPQQTQQPQPDTQQQQQGAPPAVSQEDTVNPPNDNSELLPPEAAVPAPAPSPSPAPTDDSSSGSAPAPPQQPHTPDKNLDKRPWLNPGLPISERISSLLKALTLEEKIPMMIHGQAGVPRLGLKPFQFWTGRQGLAPAVLAVASAAVA